MVLVADKNIEFTIKGLLSRPQALGTREVSSRVVPHPERDPGCFLRAKEFLRPFRERHRHALVLLDREGSGRDEQTREDLEKDLEERLAPDWGERAAAVVLDPELEVWLWSDSPHVETVLGWRGRSPTLRTWLTQAGFLQEAAVKPARPKEAVEKALRIVRKPRSSALYRQLAEKISFKRCTDPAFLKLLQVLRDWFPVAG
ncbi:MAG: hypothetical protein GY720_16825 [bacterium]|nr:hypothetical protein [bacterium]